MRSEHIILCRTQPKTTAHPLRHILTTAHEYASSSNL